MCAVLAALGFRYNNVAQGMLVVMAIGVSVPFLLPKTSWRDSASQVFVMVCLLFIGWMTLTHCWGVPRACGWWRLPERMAAFAVLLIVLAWQPDFRTMVRWLAAVALGTMAVCTTMDLIRYRELWYGSYLIGSFGFGHINYLINPFTGILLAATILHLRDQSKEVRSRRIDLVVLVSGWLLMGFLAWNGSRRGVPLAVGAGVACWMWCVVLKRWPRIAWSSLAVGAIVAAALSWSLLEAGMARPQVRGERIQQYLVGVESLHEALPWGKGEYAAIDLPFSTGPAARRLAATGGWGYHMHNEPLDVVLSGGLPAILLWIAGLGIVVWRVLRIRSDALRQAACGLGGAVFVHLMTDPVFGQDLGLCWLAVIVGTMFSAPSGHSILSWKAKLPPVRTMGWLCVPICMWGLAGSMPPATAHLEATPEVHIRCSRNSLHPQWCKLHAEAALGSAEMNDADKRKITIETEVRLGKNLDTMGWKAMSFTADDPNQAVQELVPVLQVLPFLRSAWRRLALEIERHPEQMVRLPPSIALRLRYMCAERGLPVPRQSGKIEDVDVAADMYAGLIWSLANGAPMKRLEPTMREILSVYGNVPDVGMLVLDSAMMEPEAFPWLPSVAPMLRGRVDRLLTDRLAEIQDAGEARTARRALRQIYPEADLEAVSFIAINPDYEQLVRQFIRIRQLDSQPIPGTSDATR